MTGKHAPPAVTIRSYPDSPICDVVVVVRDQEMILRCRDYRQATQWARLERKTYKIPEPDTGFPANEEAGDLPLFCVQIEVDHLPARDECPDCKGSGYQFVSG